MDANAALLIFKKFREDDGTVLCEGSLFGLSFVFRGKVTGVGENGEVDIQVSDGEASFRLSVFADGLKFKYKEPREFPVLRKILPEEARTAMALVVEFPDRSLTARVERVVAIEIT